MNKIYRKQQKDCNDQYADNIIMLPCKSGKANPEPDSGINMRPVNNITGIFFKNIISLLVTIGGSKDYIEICEYWFHVRDAPRIPQVILEHNK